MPFVYFLKEGNKMKVSNPIDMQNNDISFQTDDDRRFRLRAAAIIIENGEVLFATNTAEKYYYSIGGAIELGETAEHAVCREVMEETGVPYEIDRLVFVQELFFKRNDGMLKGLNCHEITFFFGQFRKLQHTMSHSGLFNGCCIQKRWLTLTFRHKKDICLFCNPIAVFDDNFDFSDFFSFIINIRHAA